MSGPAQDDNFSLFASETLISLWERLTATIAAMAIGIVSVFMVVGGVVIMNIMLAVVTERTHEIGIRKSIGARRRDILNQYLVESSVLAGVGGLAGVALAWAIAIRRSQSYARADGPALDVGSARRRSLRDGGAVLWHLSGEAGGQARSDRSAALREITA